MTNAEIFTQVLHEVTGQPKASIAALVEMVKHQSPIGHRWDEELPPAESAQLLAALRQERAGILNWILEGGRGA